jgi:hypothetical protein
MEADRILLALEAHLTPKVTAAGGTLQICDNPWEVVDLLKVTPEKWRLILSFEDEESIEPFNRGGWTAGVFAVYVQMHKGFAANRGESIYKTSAAGRVSLTHMAAEIRAWMRNIVFPYNDDIAKDDSSHIAFTGASWVDGTEEKGKPWRVRRMDFKIIYALDDPATDQHPDGEVVIVTDNFAIDGISEDGSQYIIVLHGLEVGRIERYNEVNDDPVSNDDGWTLARIPEEANFYAVLYNGAPDGRALRYDTVAGDAAGTGSGCRICAVSPDPSAYVVVKNGVPDGRIPRFDPA